MLPSEIVTYILEYVDRPTLISAARANHWLRIDAEALLYQNVFLPDVASVRLFASALNGWKNRHRSFAIRRLTIVYFPCGRPSANEPDPQGFLATKVILQNMPRLLQLSIWKPDTHCHRSRLSRVFSRPKSAGAYLLEARLEHDRQCNGVLSRSVRSFKASGTWAAGVSAEILQTFLRSTNPLPSLVVEVWYRSPEILAVITEHLPSLRDLEILDPDPYTFLVGANVVSFQSRTRKTFR